MTPDPHTGSFVAQWAYLALHRPRGPSSRQAWREKRVSLQTAQFLQLEWERFVSRKIKMGEIVGCDRTAVYILYELVKVHNYFPVISVLLLKPEQNVVTVRGKSVKALFFHTFSCLFW